ncbi:spore germination protein KB [Evansella caseinilytica]|uniref:Spore germination protein KB n=1 Tax=Evansella caseinilytica TaxID=1503961 RepID=A0A1H3UMK6_9BACI|nr:GerAB/ArcD/ProY family transporter [Evansella caseinilytica]SDZ63663.1 spore germination protein KB [Evansella caseinilytica]
MEKASINPFQLFALMVLFELGSAIVITIGIEAEQDAWISILLALAAGVAVFMVYSYLYKQFPGHSLIDFSQKIIGKYPGWVLGLLYMLYFLYIAMRVLRDFGDLLLTSTMPETPLFVINFFMVMTIIYVLYLGIEVLARTGEFFLLLLLLLGILANMLILFSGIIDVNNLLPVLGNGWKPVFQAAFPLVLNFPFGEIIVFTMLFPYLNQGSKIPKTGILALVFSGLLITITTSMNIAVLGMEIVSRTTFPLLTAVGKIRVADFLERLDAFVVVTLVIGMFFKIAIFTYASILGVTKLFNVNTHRKLVFPLGLILLLGSVAIAGNFSDHLEEGLDVVPYYLHMPFQIYIPFVLLLITIVRKKFSSGDIVGNNDAQSKTQRYQ